VEIDFEEVTSKKAMAIRKSKELSTVLGSDVRVGKNTCYCCAYGTYDDIMTRTRRNEPACGDIRTASCRPPDTAKRDAGKPTGIRADAGMLAKGTDPAAV
jgi:hypothetical protein